MLWLSLAGRWESTNAYRYVQAVEGPSPPQSSSKILARFQWSGGFHLADDQARHCDSLQMYAVSGKYDRRTARWEPGDEAAMKYGGNQSRNSR
jgi:hypothetical protein